MDQRYGAVAFLFFLAVSGCGGSTTTTTSNELSTAYPGDLAYGSITATRGATASLTSEMMAGLVKMQATVTNEDPVAKVEDLDGLLNPANATTFAANVAGIKDSINIFASAPNANCYGPSLNYTDHPDAKAGEPNDGQMPSGDLGIWKETEASTGEACVAAKMNNIIGEFEHLIDAGTKTVAATLGAASLDTTLSDLPAKGESQDLTKTADSTMSDNGVPLDITAATLMREKADTTDTGDPIFETSVDGTLTETEGSSVMGVVLDHVPMGDTVATLNDTYCGRLMESFNIATAEGNCAQSSLTGMTRCTLVEYCKTSATSVTYHLRTADFCGQDKECGTVDPSDKFDPTNPTSNPDGWGNNFYYTICNVNPADGSGSCAQAWQAGALDNNTRVLNVEVDAGGAAGCGYFGFGPDVASSTGVGSIDRMICNWAGPGNSHTGVAKTQRQCFTKDSSGKYISDSSNLAIRYAPTNSCNKSTANATFTYTNAGDATNTVAAGVAVTNNLIDLTTYQAAFTVPSLPSLPALP